MRAARVLVLAFPRAPELRSRASQLTVFQDFLARRDPQPEGDRTFVYQRNAHGFAKAAARHRRMRGVRGLDEMFEQAPSQIRRRNRGETRSRAAVRIGPQRELGHQHQAATRVLERKVHFPSVVGEDPVAQHLFEQTLGARCRISSLRTYQDEEPRADIPDARSRNTNLRRTDPLQETYHGCIT